MSAAFGQGTAFTYQGRLDAGGSPAEGNFDLTFALYNASTGGAQVGGTQSYFNLSVHNGLFTVPLDFGSVFDGTSLWLQIGVRTNGGGAYTPSTPRQELTPTPYAIAAEKVVGNVAASQLTGTLPSSVLSGTYSSPLTLNNPANSFTGNGAGLANVNALTLDGLGTNRFWQTTGNAGMVPGVNFLGTSDGAALELHSSTFVGVNRTTKLSSEEYFGIDAPATNDYGGMYVRTLGTNSLPFYGYVNANGGYAWTYLDGFDTNKWKLFIGSAPALTVTPAGLVGIGSQAPATRLEAAGPSGTSIRVSGPGGGGTQVAYDLATYNPGTNEPGARLLATDTNYSADLDLQTKIPGASANALVSRLRIASTGNVGINNLNPAAQLHVERVGPSGQTDSFGGGPAVWGDTAVADGVVGSSAATDGSGVLGLSSGANGAGVVGRANNTNNTTAYGVAGYTTSTNGAGVYASAATSTSAALTIGNGGIRVAGAGNGTPTAAFVHLATTTNSVGNPPYVTEITNPLCDGDPHALLFVTHSYSPPGYNGNYETHPFSVWYNGVKWTIYNDDITAITNMTFNVLVIKP